MTLDVNKDKLTILGVQFDNFPDFDTVWYAIGSSMIENYEPTVQDVIDSHHLNCYCFVHLIYGVHYKLSQISLNILYEDKRFYILGK